MQVFKHLLSVIKLFLGTFYGKTRRGKAISFISNKLEAIPKKQKKNIWPAIICSLFLTGILGRIISTILNSETQESDSNVVVVSAYPLPTPNNWTEYKIDDAIYIAVPNTMEIRHDYDNYTQWIMDSIGVINTTDVVFQQKDLSTMSTDAYNTYARILVQHFPSDTDEVEHHDESPSLTTQDYSDLREIVDDEIYPYSYVESPSWRWIEINGFKALEGSYKRTGEDGTVICKLYFLSNYSEFAKILIAYCEKDSIRWSTDLNNIISTFEWKYPK